MTWMEFVAVAVSILAWPACLVTVCLIVRPKAGKR